MIFESGDVYFAKAKQDCAQSRMFINGTTQFRRTRMKNHRMMKCHGFAGVGDSWGARRPIAESSGSHKNVYWEELSDCSRWDYQLAVSCDIWDFLRIPQADWNPASRGKRCPCLCLKWMAGAEQQIAADHWRDVPWGQRWRSAGDVRTFRAYHDRSMNRNAECNAPYRW